VMISGRYDDKIAAHLRAGGCALLIAESPDALPPEWPLHVCLRAGTELDGRWFSNFNWIRAAQEPFASVAFSRILGFEAATVAPGHIIRGIGPEDFGDVLAGITYGWLNNNSALAAQMRVGPGKLIITTFRFDRFGVDPYATRLLHSLLRYVSSPQCSPRMQLAVTVSSSPESVASRT
jgi:hypothetical protein